MPTSVPIGSALARKLYSTALFAEVQRKPSFRKNITGPAPKQSAAEAKLKGQTSADYPIVRVTDLAKTAGEQISIDLFDIIAGKPVMGDNKLSGKGMSLSYSSQDIRIDQYRGMVDPGGRMTQQRTVHNLRGIAMANLSSWGNRLDDQLCLIHMAGARGFDNGRDWVVPLASDADFSNIAVNSILPPTTNRRYTAEAGTSSAAGVDSNDYLLLPTIDRMRAILDEAVHPLQAIMLPGDPESEENPLYCLYLTSRQWHYLQTSTTDPAWRTFLANAMQRSNGFNHPLFKGQAGMWNGVLIKKMARAIRFPTGSDVVEYDDSTATTTSTVQTAVDVDRALLIGAQALADCYGRHNKSGFHYNWNEEETDHGNTVEVSIAAMGGKSKIRFSVKDSSGVAVPTDHGVITLDSYAPAIT